MVAVAIVVRMSLQVARYKCESLRMDQDGELSGYQISLAVPISGGL